MLYVICGFALVGISCLLDYIGVRSLEGSALFPALNPIEKPAPGDSISRPAVLILFSCLFWYFLLALVYPRNEVGGGFKLERRAE